MIVVFGLVKRGLTSLHIEGEARVVNAVGMEEGGKDSVFIVVKSDGIRNVRIAKQKEVVQGVGAVSLRVGDVDVPVGGQERGAKVRKVAVVEKNAGGKEVAEVSKSTDQVGVAEGMDGPSKSIRCEMKRKEADTSVIVKEQQRSHYIPVFHSRSQDLKWAHSGLVATVLEEESTLAIQQKMEDAGFPKVVITPIGGDRVFLHCNEGEEMWTIFNDAIHFFGMMFSIIRKWSPSEVMYERGAWLHIYGIPINARS